ncbi:MAG: heparinase II/III family protein [Verrucomicrobiota bacterium]
MPDANRICEIASWLPTQPTGVGQPITNRAAWNDLAIRRPELNALIRWSAKLAAQPFPEQPDSLFLEFTKNGNRTHWERAASARRTQVPNLTLAECLENKGRFLAPLERAIAALCAERTWVMSACDPKLENFRGVTIEIDLGSSTLGVELATANYLLGDRLSPTTRKLIRDNLERRIFAPYRAAATGVRKEFWWMHGRNNWNAVCLNGVTGAALATIGPAQERAWYVALAEKNIDAYLTGGFTPDGYCVEGLAYWNYGFGNFTVLAENIRQATGGKIDLLSNPLAAQPALFGLRSEIINGVCTTIADCSANDKPSGILMNYLSRRLGLDSTPWRKTELIGWISGGLYEKTAMAFLPGELPLINTANTSGELAWRTRFPDGGILICRSGTGAQASFAAAIKGGNNGVSHGHNDAGSFSVVAGTNMVICDPGGEVYTKRTFSPQRYDSKLLNSFGHSVPVVAGQLQRTGSAARAAVVASSFNEAADTLTFDLRSAYAVADLLKLERKFIYHRGQTPALEMRDEVAFGRPESFESVLVTRGTIKTVSATTIEITDGDSTVRVTIDTQGRSFQLKPEIIDEDGHTKHKPVHLV